MGRGCGEVWKGQVEPWVWMVRGGGRPLALKKSCSFANVATVLARWWQVWSPYSDRVNEQGQG